MFSAQTRTRRSSDTLDRLERAEPRSDRERPRIEGSLKLISTQVWLVRRELHDARLRDDVRQRRQLHGAGHVHVPLAMEWRRLPSTGL